MVLPRPQGGGLVQVTEGLINFRRAVAALVPPHGPADKAPRSLALSATFIGPPATFISPPATLLSSPLPSYVPRPPHTLPVPLHKFPVTSHKSSLLMHSPIICSPRRPKSPFVVS